MVFFIHYKLYILVFSRIRSGGAPEICPCVSELCRLAYSFSDSSVDFVIYMYLGKRILVVPTFNCLNVQSSLVVKLCVRKISARSGRGYWFVCMLLLRLFMFDV